MYRTSNLIVRLLSIFSSSSHILPLLHFQLQLLSRLCSQAFSILLPLTPHLLLTIAVLRLQSPLFFVFLCHDHAHAHDLCLDLYLGLYLLHFTSLFSQSFPTYLSFYPFGHLIKTFIVACFLIIVVIFFLFVNHFCSCLNLPQFIRLTSFNNHYFIYFSVVQLNLSSPCLSY